MGLTPEQQRIYSIEDMAIFNLLEQPVWVFDIEAKAMWWANRAALTLWSADSLESLLARNFKADMSEASERRLLDYLARFRKGERLKDQWTFYPNGNGPVTVSTTTLGVCIEEGHMAMLVDGVIIDVKDDAEKASLRGIEILRHLPIAVSQFDVEGNLTDENPEALATFTVRSNSPSTVSESSNESADDSSAKSEQMDQATSLAEETDENDLKREASQEATNGIGGCQFVNRFVDRNLGDKVLREVCEGKDASFEALQHTVKGPRWFALKIRRTKDPVTTKPIILYSARDITDVVEAKRADQENMAKSEFLAVMAHEIRTPLHQVISVIELLGLTKLNSEQTQFLSLMQTAAMSLMTVINDLLDYSKLEAGKMSLDNIPFNSKGVAEGALAAVAPQAEKKGVALRTNLCSKIPDQVMGDPNRLRQVLLNLIQNAIKFTDKGSIELQVQHLATEGGQSRLRFSVRDTGIGMSREQQKRIFKKYQQANDSISGKYGGSGLGLVICKSLVELMGGTIGLESVLHQGTTVWFEIPFAVPTKVESSEKEEDPAGETHHSLHVLLVEDNKVNQKVMGAMLKRLGHEVTLANDGQEAVDKVQGENFDVVLMDIQMPVMDGIEATARIRSMGRSKATLPILALTASVQRSDHEEVGMNGWLSKPLRMQTLKKVLEEYQDGPEFRPVSISLINSGD